MPQPIIGITMSMDNYGKIRQGTDYSFIRSVYGEQVKKWGGQPIFLDSTIDPSVAARICDGIIISGGDDINPATYDHPVANAGMRLEPMQRTLWEKELIKACDSVSVPILGVCYGAQLLNIHYGGTLYQDLATERPGSLSHGESAKAQMHSVTFTKDFLGFKEAATATTAHRHHQAINQLAPGFQVAAHAPDGTIEAISGHGHYGVQWHAESDDTAGRIYTEFIAHCTQKSAPRSLRQILRVNRPKAFNFRPRP